MPTAHGQDVIHDPVNKVFIVPEERFRELVTAEAQLQAALDLIDIKDKIIESKDIIITEQSAIITAKDIILEVTEKEKSAFELQSKIFGGLSILFGTATLIESLILAFR